MDTKLLVVDDDPNICEVLRVYFENEGYQVKTAQDGVEGINFFKIYEPDLVLLDIMMPRMDGFEFTDTLRRSGCNLPILMVSAKMSPVDKRKGFIIGTDDYMTKPIDEEEMVLRVGALLRRSKIASERKITVGNTVLVYDSFTVESNGKKYELPQKEFMLLFKLLSYQNKIFTRRQLMDEIWDMDSESDERTVDVHISRLRDRFKYNQDFDIITVRGLGYKAVCK